jgi:23S rRNA (uridine2552-2'-O)-methyltransferase
VSRPSRRNPRKGRDAYGERARREGFPARSVYKLEEIDRRVGLFTKGQRVLDLGAAPGSWTMYAAERVGLGGKVIAIDLDEIRAPLPNVEIHQADARALAPEIFGAPYDVVISDMAPRTTGARDADQYRSFELFMTALEIAKARAKPGASFVGKIFQGPEFDQARAAVAAAFEQARILRPKATRDVSYEVFLVGLRRRAT